MTTLTKETVKATWRITEDYPTVDGEYVVCFSTSEGDYGYPDIWFYSDKGGWEPALGTDHPTQPTHWCSLPFPR